MLNSSFYDYSYVYILLIGTKTVSGEGVDDAARAEIEIIRK